MNDFNLEPVELRSAMISGVEDVFKSGHYVLGKTVLEFEESWAKACKSNYSVGVANGLDALEISLRAIGIKAGDEVITSSMTAFATVLAILKVGAVPVFADINENSALLCLESAKRCLSSKTKAIVLVHLYGFIDAMEDWVAFCAEHKLLLVEDCAQSHFAKFQGKSAGSFGVCGAYSFYPTKNLGCIGDAGAIVTNDQNINQLARSLRNYGQLDRYQHTHVGTNSRLDEIQAAILLVRLKYLEGWTEKRRLIANKYFDQIDNPKIRLMKRPTNKEQHVHHLFVIRSKDRAKLAAHLASEGIQTIIHYPIPAHLQTAKFIFKADVRGLKNTEQHADTCLSIPVHPYLSEDEVLKIISAVNNY